MKAIIVAVGRQNEIGADNDMPWSKSLKDDLRHFKELTSGHSIIVGRKTFESFGGKPLPNRENIVISRTPIDVDGIIHAHSLDEAYRIASHDTVFVIGGGQIYKEAITNVDVLYVTEVKASFVDATVFFPTIDLGQWREVSRQHHLADERNNYAFDFVIYERSL